MAKNLSFAAVVSAAVILLTCPAASFAAGGVSFSAAVVPIGAADAGSGAGRPEYDEAFDTGWAARIEPYFDFTPMIRGQFGVAYNKWGGTTFDSPSAGPVTFSDLKVTAYYIGVKVRFLPNSNIRPYAVADIGAAHLSSVDAREGAGPARPYWGSSTTAFFDVGGGVEFRVSPQVAFFLDVRAQATGEPDSKSTTLNSDADPVGSVPISAGVNISF